MCIDLAKIASASDWRVERALPPEPYQVVDKLSPVYIYIYIYIYICVCVCVCVC